MTTKMQIERKEKEMDQNEIHARDKNSADEQERVFARYHAELGDTDMSEDAQRGFLLALFQIMRAFVDLGFSVRSGDKFTSTADLGMDDVLHSLCLDDTAHETVAPATIPEKEEQP